MASGEARIDAMSTLTLSDGEAMVWVLFEVYVTEAKMHVLCSLDMLYSRYPHITQDTGA
jgi:hypothetical protein